MYTTYGTMREYLVLIVLISVLRSTSSFLVQTELDAMNLFRATLSPDLGWPLNSGPCSWSTTAGSVTCLSVDGEEHVEELALSGPFLAVEIGSWITKLPYLKRISFSNVTFSAPISDRIALAPALAFFSLFHSKNVQFPTFTTGIAAPLREIAIINTDLAGEFPDLRPFPNLTRIDIYENQIDGVLPAYLGGLTRLQWLSIHNNKITGTIPIELTQLPNLRGFFAHGNRLTGTIPSEFGAMELLIQLHLSNNQLNGTIPKQLASAYVSYQRYNGNKLTGSIPVEYGLMTYLYDFDVSNNLLTGTIPMGLKDLPYLLSFNVSNNPLSGCFNVTFQRGDKCDISSTNLCCIPTNPQCLKANVECVPCPQPPPQPDAKCQVNEDNEPVWVIDGDLVLSSGVSVDNIIVNGNLTITGDLSVSDGAITVYGCLNFNGSSSLFLTLTSEEIEALTQSGQVERALLFFDSTCDTSNLDFDAITVAGDVSDCVTLNARQDTKPGLVTIIIVTDDSACSSVPSGYLLVPALPDWAIAVIVVGAVIVAGAVILTAILVSNKQKKVASRKMSHKLNWKGS